MVIMDTLLLVFNILSFLLTAGLIGFMIYFFMKKFPKELANRVRTSKAHGARLQKKMNDLVELDVTNFINDNPTLLDIFPESIAHMEETKAQPQWLNAVISMFAPAASSVLMNSGSDRNLTANNVAGSLLSNPDAISGILSFLGNIRQQAKTNYKKKELPEKAKSVTATPVAEGY